MRIATKIFGMGAGLVLAAVGILLGCSIWQQHLLKERWAEVVETLATGEAKQVVRNVYRMARMAHETSEAAQHDILPGLRRSIRDIAIGKSGYVFVVGGRGSQQGKYLISKRGDRDGENLWNLQDAEGRYLIRSLVDEALALKEKHQGTDIPVAVEHYLWQNPEDSAPRPKTAVLAYFEPWDWVIGASYYRDELAESRQQIGGELNEMRRWNVVAATMIVVLLLAASFVIAQGIGRPLTIAIQIFRRFGKDRSGMLAIDRDGQDEIGQLSNAFDRLLAVRDELEAEIAECRLAERKFKESRSYLEHLAYHDSLTGLPNRLLFHDRFRQILRRAARHRQIVALLCVDLDQFKNIKATLGHAVSDEILVRMGRRLRACIRDEDTIARLGGDEFIVTLEQLGTEFEISMIARRFLFELGKPLSIQDHKLYVTASIGIALYPSNGEDAESLMRAANVAMHQAKSLGRNQYSFYSPTMNARALEMLTLENDLRAALEGQQFELYYQPQVDLGEPDRVVGAEALLRWNHPTRGLIPPGDFISLAEETDLVIPLGAWVLRQACKQVRIWSHENHRPIRVAVNLSAKQFRKQDFVGEIKRILTECATNAGLLELELTESVVMDDAEHAIGILMALRDMGIGLAIDDFGTGYSSMGYLKRFPIQKLKIDRQFVRDINVDRNDAAIVEATLALARSLELDVVAEGIETAEQLAFLKDHGCRLGQGYLFGKPTPAEQFGRLYLDKEPPIPDSSVAATTLYAA